MVHDYIKNYSLHEIQNLTECFFFKCIESDLPTFFTTLLKPLFVTVTHGSPFFSHKIEPCSQQNVYASQG